MLNYAKQDNRTSKKTVLVVDENQELCAYLASQITFMGLSSRTANDAVSAVKIMEQRFPDLLIFDSELPARGKTFLERVEADPESCEIPAIVLCDNDDLSSVTRAPTLMAYYIQKTEEAWDKIEMLIHELVDTGVSSTNEPPNDDNFNNGANQ